MCRALGMKEVCNGSATGCVARCATLRFQVDKNLVRWGPRLLATMLWYLGRKGGMSQKVPRETYPV